jgi:hypothetical protein
MRHDTPTLSNSTSNGVAIEIENGLTYNPDQISIEGAYPDELSVQRVKKTWCTILETDFLLIPKTDFEFNKEQNTDAENFTIKCRFTSACGRYAFWRLLNEQAPEVQFLLETAHESHRFQDYRSFIESVTSPEPQTQKALSHRLLIGLIDQLDSIRAYFVSKIRS